MEARKDDTSEAREQRLKLREAIELKNYEFNTHGVELNQRYRSAAVVSDGTPEPGYDRDPELYYHPTTWPGAAPPLLAGSQGTEGQHARPGGEGPLHPLHRHRGRGLERGSAGAGTRVGVEIACFVIGAGREVLGLYDDWARISQVAESSCVLVRPDAHVAWRRHTVADDCAAELARVMYRILGFEQPPSEEAARVEETVEA